MSNYQPDLRHIVDIRIVTTGGLLCHQDPCPYASCCANHISAGDHRNEAGPSPKLRLHAGKVYCESITASRDATYDQPANSEHQGEIALDLETQELILPQCDGPTLVLGDGSLPTDGPCVTVSHAEFDTREIPVMVLTCGKCKRTCYMSHADVAAVQGVVRCPCCDSRYLETRNTP